MNLSAEALPAGSSQQVVSTSRLRRVLLGLAHGVWIAVVLIDVTFFVPGALLYDRVMHQPCPSRTVPVSACAGGQFTPAALRAFPHFGVSLDLYAALALALTLLASVVVFVTGALIAWKKWDEGIGLLASALLVTRGASGSGAVFTSVVQQVVPAHAPQLTGILYALGGPIFILQWPALGAFLLTFPTGRFAPRWTWLLVGLWITNFFAHALNPPPIVTIVSAVITYGSVAVVQVYRYRRVYGPTERQQTKWLVYALAIMVGLDLAETGALALSPSPSHSAFSSIVVAAVGTIGGDAISLLAGLAIAIALLRYRLYDIDLIINRTLVYGGLTVLVLGGYVLIVGYLGAVFQARSNLAFSLLATGVVAVLFQPARQRLQQGVNHLLYGDRDDPYAAIARLGRQLEAALAPEAVLPTVASTIRDALKLPYAALSVAGDTGVAAASGEPRGELLRLPLVHAGEPLGELILSPRARGEGWTASERRLLVDLAHSAGGAVQAVRLTQELQHSRERLVLAREEERRRLRRDLHDELAPSLAALALTASTALDLIPEEAIRARQLITELQQALRESVGEVRRLAHDLRPPTLDELGLAAAVRERAQQVTGARESGYLQVTVEAPAALPPLPAAVEVAAYRIIQEALMNVLRHAHARQCLIRLVPAATASGSVLEVTVEDDGVGVPEGGDGRAHGVGLRSMQERATELSGTCTIERSGAGGTCVRAVLPVGAVRLNHRDQLAGAG